MRHFIISLFSIVMFSSCGSSKKAIAKTSEQNNPEVVTIKTETAVETEPEVEVEVEVENENENENENVSKKEIKNDSLGFNHNLSKLTGPLHFLFEELLEKNVSKEGNVDYKGFKKSHEQLLGYISILQNIYPKIDSVFNTKEQKLAYWINAYNALTIDLILRHYPLKSIKDIKDPWDQRLWKFGDQWVNLNQIEHEILRKMDEPRIHFAIVCASFSCPKLQNKAFTASKLETQLTAATEEFLADEKRNTITKNSLELSKIFKWFKKDFEQSGRLIDFLNTYTVIEISSNAKKSFKAYNWDLND